MDTKGIWEFEYINLKSEYVNIEENGEGIINGIITSREKRLFKNLKTKNDIKNILENLENYDFIIRDDELEIFKFKRYHNIHILEENDDSLRVCFRNTFPLSLKKI